MTIVESAHTRAAHTRASHTWIEVCTLDDLEVELLTEALRSAFVDSATGEAVLDEFRVLLEKAQPRQVKRST